MSQMTEYKQKMAMALHRNREGARRMVDGLEVGGAALVSGYLVESYPEVAGVPSDAALALVALTAGFTMKQRDLMCIGLGFGAGFLRDKGRELAKEHPVGSVLPFTTTG